jgi:cysteine-rich repeat protein
MRALLALTLLTLLACKDEIVVEDGLTGIDLTLRYDRGAGLDQIALSGTLDDGSVAFAPGRLPESPRPLATGESSVVILLPDALAGRPITVVAEGLAGGAVVLTGRIRVTPVSKQLVQASGTLDAMKPCGNGLLDGTEACDDMDTESGDGCSDACTVEAGYVCSGAPSICVTDCGDGAITGAEACDDGDAESGDGCSSTCTAEPGFTCTGAPSTCAPNCGDGSIVGTETCDDGNATGGDGCTACTPDPGYTCAGEPSVCTCAGDQDADGITDCEDTCIDADEDTYGAPGAAGNTCIGPDCDDMKPLCTTVCEDVDVDLLLDCEDTCIDADGDGYGAAGGAGNTCSGADCDDAAMTCTTDCAADADADSIADCADTCLDGDGDNYGVAGGAGNTCSGTDCDDTSMLCSTDCTTDADTDSVRDCEDGCLDIDGDNYGTAGGAGNTCTGLDCDEASATCNTDCAANADADATRDCDDTCIDGDGDNYGTAGGAGDTCTGPDCNDAVPTCRTNCTTNVDSDALVDCADTCIDRDGDMYGTAGGAGNTCLGTDCNDQAATCLDNNCGPNLDMDGVPDCADTCIDRDGDMRGTAGGAGNTCIGTDCDDMAATCTTNCTTDADTDSTPDCRDTCLDGDDDNYGVAGGGGNTCTGTDCNDTIGTCTTNCTTNLDGDSFVDCADTCIDVDGDGYGTNGGAGSCAGADCDDTRVACNTSCAACLPQFLTLTSNGPVPACTDATLTVDLDGYDNAENDLTCTAGQVDVLPLENFASGTFGRWSTRVDAGDVTIRTFPDGFPVSCNTLNYVSFNNDGPDYFQLGTPLDTTNLENLSINFRAGYKTNTGNGDNISVLGCCGAGCTPVSFFTALNGSSGGTDNCTNYNVALPAYATNCSSLMIRFSFVNSNSDAGVDSIEVVGDVSTFNAFTETAVGIYTSPFRVCEPMTVAVTCTWDNGTPPTRSDTENVVFQ